jgi:hypothetical protein
MKPISPNRVLSKVEVTLITRHGLWLLTTNRELFVSFIEFPQFRNVPSIKLKHVAQLHSDILYWPDLHIEIPVKHVRCFPLTCVKPHPPRRSGRQTKARSVTV